jgi:RimJ/RimL family protein N-acetyltransferase
MNRYMNAPVTIKTSQESVVLRQLSTEGDDAAYYAAYNATRDEIVAYEPEAIDKYVTPDEVREARVNPEDPHKLRFGVWSKDTFVGSINLTPIDEEEAEIGYWCDSRHKGQGYTTLAARALAVYAADRYAIVSAEVVDGNDASARVLARAGFQQTAYQAGRLIFEFKK